MIHCPQSGSNKSFGSFLDEIWINKLLIYPDLPISTMNWDFNPIKNSYERLLSTLAKFSVFP